jgi:hypothetical protein
MGVKLKKLVNYIFDCIKKDWLTTLILCTAFILYMMVIVPSGSRYCFEGRCGIYFWGAHEHDAVWHLALIESAFKTFPFIFPVLSGQLLGGYNYLLDIVLHILTFTGISAPALYFKIQPIMLFGVFSFLLYQAGRLVRIERSYIRWLFFFVFFSTSFGILIQWFKHHTLSGSVGNPTMQGALNMTNPQFMWSLCVLLAIWIITRNHKWAGWLGVLIFVGLGLKFYFIVPALILIFWYVLTLIISRKFKDASLTVLSTGIGLGIAYLVFYMGGASGGLVWKPLEIPHQMIEDTNLWYDQIMVQERYYIQQLGHIWSPRLWWIEARTIFYFIFFNFGIRLFGVVGIILFAIFNKKNTRQFIPILLALVVSTLMPVLFIQRGTWWNSIQFLYYAIFLSSILTAEFVWQCIHQRNKLLTIIIIVVCVCLFLPTNYELATMYTSRKGVRYIPDEEIQALQSLRKLPYGVVLTQAFSRKETNILADNYDTAYISAYSGKPVYLADKDQLNLLGPAYTERLKTLIDDPCSLLSEVQYVYIRVTSVDQAMSNCVDLPVKFTRIFNNDMASVWRKN